MNFSKPIIVGLAVIAFILIANAVLSYTNTRQLQADNARVSHAYRILDELEKLRRLTADAEAGHRGYLLTDDERYLEPYRQAEENIESHLERVRKLTRGIPRQEVRMEDLKKLIKTRWEEMEQVLTLYRAGGLEAAQHMILLNDDQRTTARIQSLLYDMRATEYALLIEHVQQSNRTYLVALLSDLLTTMAGLGAVGAFVWLLRSHLQAQQKSTAEIQEQKEFLQTTLASIADGVIATDTQGRIKFLNGVARSLIGRTEAEAVGQPLESVFHVVNEKTRKMVENPALRALREGLVVQLSNHSVLISQDGTERAIDDNAAPIWNYEQLIAGAVLIFRDVTERRQREQLLRTREEEFRAAFENVAVGMAQIDPKTKRFLRMNDRFCDLTGYSRSELLQMTVFDLDHPDDREQDRTHLDRAFQSKQRVYHVEKRYIRKDGRIIWVEVTATLILDAEGRPDRTVAVIQDITERKQAEIERDRFFTVGADMRVVIGFDGYSKRMNPAWGQILGWTADEMSSRPLLDFVHPDDQEATIAAAEKLFRGEELGRFENRYRCRDGTYRWLSWKAKPFVDEQLIYSGAMDVTERKQAEQALQEANRRKDEFLAMLGHELRNPLAAIKGGISLLQMNDIDESLQRSTKAVLVQQIDHIVRLVDDLLDVSRIVRGKIEIRKQIIPLQRALDEAIRIAWPIIESNQCQFEKFVPSQPVMLCADPVRLAQVFGNLLNNAAKYSRKCRIELRAEVAEDEAVVRVRDWGIGIEPELLERVFDPFVQSERSLARSEGGLGLGLTLVQRLVELHGGRVEAFSEGRGRGSEFAVYLPLPDQDFPGEKS